MTRQEFKNFIKDYGPVILDGATGTNLMAAGMPVGVCPEAWILEHPRALLELQKGYVRAGTRILYAPTFTGNRIKLGEYGLEDRLEEINRKLVQLSRQAAEEAGKAEAAGEAEETGKAEEAGEAQEAGEAEAAGKEGGCKRRVLVAGDLTMCGRQLYPLGELQFEELVEVYKEQGRVLAEAGADLFVVETMMSLQETRAAVIALREVADLPIMVSLTYNEDGRTLYGTPPEVAVTVLQALGADVIGINCSTGPTEMMAPVRKMAEYATVPILAKPNAGLPELEGDATVYRMTPEEFAEAGAALVEAGAALLGGCCGTRPEHIKALSDRVKGMAVREPLRTHRRILASERQSVEIGLEGNFMVVGERINPTGKKKLQAELREGKLDMVRRFAMEQEENGARILDVNTGMNGIDEKEMMQQVIYEVTSTVDCPLCIDTSDPEVMEQALRIYPGRALINSISLERVKIEKVLPVAKKYGAMFILLPLSDAGLPKDGADKHRILEEVCDKALAIGMTHEDIIVDALVATIGADPEAANSCMETVDYCKRTKKLPTICGLSNISFGLPERGAVNAAFLTLMIGKGLTMAIANPSQELLMNAAYASDMLLNRPDSDIRYIEHMNRLREEHEKQAAAEVRKRERELAERMAARGMAGDSGAETAVRSFGERAGMAAQSVGEGTGTAGRAGAGTVVQATVGTGERAGIAGRSAAADPGRLPRKVAGNTGSEGGLSVEGAGERAGIADRSAAADAGRAGAETAGNSGEALQENPVYQAVLKGNKGTIVDEVKQLLNEGSKPDAIINEVLIPAIGKVGDLFNEKRYFLPQLIGSANAMKLAIDYLEPLLESKGDGKEMATVVIATVEGDIHDIGKNLVALMLKNYGYNVIDMGKDVPAEDIVNKAMEEQAQVIALSALMTTTMIRMKDVVELARKKGCTGKIVIGGACITESYAEEIGADGYSKDAADCVKLVERLLS